MRNGTGPRIQKNTNTSNHVNVVAGLRILLIEGAYDIHPHRQKSQRISILCDDKTLLYIPIFRCPKIVFELRLLMHLR